MIWTLLLFTAEARKGPVPPPPVPPIVVTPPDPPPSEPGSLWNEVSARQLMGMDGNARQVGDLITFDLTVVNQAPTAQLVNSTQGVGNAINEGESATVTFANKEMTDGLYCRD